MNENEFLQAIKNLRVDQIEQSNVFAVAFELLTAHARTTDDKITTGGKLYADKDWLVPNYCAILEQILETYKMGTKKS